MASITGINAHFVLDNASNVPTDISSYVTAITPTVDTEEFSVKVFKATRTEKVFGFTTEDWDVTGPWSAAADTFWRALAGLAAGQGVDYILGPQGSTAGQVKYTGTANVLKYEHDAVTAEGVLTYTARLSILSKAAGTF